MRPSTCLLGLGFLFATVPGHLPAQATATPAVSPAASALLDARAVFNASRAVTPEAYPDAETVSVDGFYRCSYEATGAYSVLNEDFTKVLTEEGLRSARENSFSYNAFYGFFEILAIEVYKPDGKVVKLDPKAVSKEQIDRSSMAANIYDPNDKLIVATIPDLEVGDLVRVFTRRGENKPRMAGAFSDWNVLESTSPILRQVVEITGPKQLPLKSKGLLGQVGETVATTEQTLPDGRLRTTWTARNVPQIFPEPGMPAYYTVGQRLIVSTLSDWKEISRWYWKLCEPRFAHVTPEMKAKVADLTAKAVTTEEKIRAIFTFVSQDIRYMGIIPGNENTSPGYEPHDVNLTFNNRYGVCRDKAALLVVMLREAGFEAFPVLINNGPKKDPEVPAPFFNHAISAVRLADGKYMLMDSTDETTSDLFPTYLNDKSYLVATPEGDTLRTSPLESADKNLLSINTEVNLDANGSVSGSTTLNFLGINDNAYRGFLSQRKPDEIRRTFEGILKGVLPGASLGELKFTPSNFRDTSQPLRAKITFTAPNVLATGPGAAQFDLPWFGAAIGVFHQILGESVSLEKRRFPIETEYACGVREELSINLPPSLGAPLALPAYENVQHPDFAFNQELKYEGTRLAGVLDLRINNSLIPVSAYPELKKALRSLEFNRRQSPAFSRADAVSKASSADVRVIDNLLTYKLENENNWTVRQTVRKRIMTYAGKKNSSEITLDYNPVWTSIAIESATVTTKEGEVKKVAPEEINTLDADWVAAAPRYPGAKTMVIALPGVDIGSTLDYTLVYTCKDRPFFSTSHTFAGFDPVAAYEVVFDLPSRLNPKFVSDFPSIETQAEGRRIVTFERANLAVLAKETNLPPLRLDFPDMAASTSDWKTWAASLAPLIEKAVKPSKAVTAKARELAIGLQGDDKKITVIRDFVARSIREAGPDFDSLPPAQAFSPAETTLADGYGHQADRALLLASLLRAAGFKPEVFFVAPSSVGLDSIDAQARDCPQLGWFDTLGVRLPSYDKARLGDWLYLDTASQYAALGVTNLEGEQALTTDGNYFVIEVPELFRDLVTSNLAVEFDREGTATVTVTTTYQGTAFESYVQGHRERTPEEKERYHQELISGLAQSARPAGPLEADFNYPGVERYKAVIPRFAISTPSTFYFDLPGLPQALFRASSDQRDQPYFVSSEIRVRQLWNVTLPPGLKPLLTPAPLDWQGPGALGGAKLSVKAPTEASPRSWEFRFDSHLKPAIVPTGSYPSLLDLNRRLGQPSARRMLFGVISERL